MTYLIRWRHPSRRRGCGAVPVLPHSESRELEREQHLCRALKTTSESTCWRQLTHLNSKIFVSLKPRSVDSFVVCRNQNTTWFIWGVLLPRRALIRTSAKRPVCKTIVLCMYYVRNIPRRARNNELACLRAILKLKNTWHCSRDVHCFVFAKLQRLSQLALWKQQRCHIRQYHMGGP